MSAEIETAAAASAGGWLRLRRRASDIPPGAPCANCETPLMGTYCHACGQFAGNFHKSIWKLSAEMVRDFFNVDGRLALTLPQLAWRPGRLTRDYVDGRRAPQVPPLRLFLIVLVLTFLVGGLTQNANDWSIVRGGAAAVDERYDGVGAPAGTPQITAPPSATENWIRQRYAAIQAEPGRFSLLLGVWAQRVALLLIPISTLILALLYVMRRDVYVFDHLIFTLHSLSFQLLLTTLVMVLARWTGAWAWNLLWLAPIHLFAHMRGAYRSGVFSTLARMGLLFSATMAVVVILLVVWLALAFNAMSGG